MKGDQRHPSYLPVHLIETAIHQIIHWDNSIRFPAISKYDSLVPIVIFKVVFPRDFVMVRLMKIEDLIRVSIDPDHHITMAIFQFIIPTTGWRMLTGWLLVCFCFISTIQCLMYLPYFRPGHRDYFIKTIFPG